MYIQWSLSIMVTVLADHLLYNSQVPKWLLVYISTCASRSPVYNSHFLWARGWTIIDRFHCDYCICQFLLLAHAHCRLRRSSRADATTAALTSGALVWLCLSASQDTDHFSMAVLQTTLPGKEITSRCHCLGALFLMNLPRINSITKA